MTTEQQIAIGVGLVREALHDYADAWHRRDLAAVATTRFAAEQALRTAFDAIREDDTEPGDARQPVIYIYGPSQPLIGGPALAAALYGGTVVTTIVEDHDGGNG